MPTSVAATIDPAETMRAAIADAYDRLRQLVDEFAARRDDPALLDEIGALTRRVRGRITRARKRAQVDAEPASGSAHAVTATPAPVVESTTVQGPAVVVPAAIPTSSTGERVSVRPVKPAAKTPVVSPSPSMPRHGRHRKSATLARRAAVGTADFTWKSVRGALFAVAVGAIAAFGGRGMAEAGVQAIWIWLWGIAAFIAFGAGLCFWTMSAAERWDADVPATNVPAEPATEDEPAPAASAEQPVEAPRQIIAWEDESDRDYRRFVELRRP